MSDNSNSKNKKEMTFEAAIARLEEIVRALEGSHAPLDESLALFEEGVTLVKLCNSKLDTAQQKIVLMTKGDEGELVETDFVPHTEKGKAE